MSVKTGLKEGYRRVTWSVLETHYEEIKAVAHWKRYTQEKMMNEIIEGYLAQFGKPDERQLKDVK